MNRIKKWFLKKLITEIGNSAYPCTDPINCRIFMIALNEGDNGRERGFYHTPEKMQFFIYPTIGSMGDWNEDKQKQLMQKIMSLGEITHSKPDGKNFTKLVVKVI